MHNDRYVLLLDILGFKALVEQGKADEARRAVDIALAESDKWASGKGAAVDFDTLYFSDTIILYTREPGDDREWYDDLVYIGARVVTSLLGAGFPVRGALAFGDFTVEPHGRHAVYVGKALIDAHLAEEKFGILGFVVLASALDAAFPDRTARFGSGMRSLGLAILAPEGLIVNWMTQFHGRANCDNRWEIEQFLAGAVGAGQLENPWIPVEVAAFQFVTSRAAASEADGDIAGPVARKYHATCQFLRAVLGKSMFVMISDGVHTLADFQANLARATDGAR